PSSALRLTPASLSEKAAEETGFLATDGSALLGCVFLAERGSDLYLGKFAVEPKAQRQGIGRTLFDAAERHARHAGKTAIEPQTRIELIANQQTFHQLRFR